MDKIIGKKICKSLSGKYSQKLYDNDKKSATDSPKTSSKRVFQKVAEATRDLFANKIANKIPKVSK